jgi:glycosyltransferase involved in cell wall biosynthesis
VIPLWIRARHGLPADAAARKLAYLGRLIPLKRVHLLIESLLLMPGYGLRVIGDGPERRGLEALAHALGLSARVEFLGHVGNDGLESALAGASLLVVPTAENPRQAEQFGKAALEGVSFGLPVLASRTGNLAALARRFPTLSACDLDTPAQVADAVSALFAAYPDQAALAASRRQAESEYGHIAASLRLQAAFRESLGPAAGESVP